MNRWVAENSWLVVLMPVLLPGIAIGILLGLFMAFGEEDE